MSRKRAMTSQHAQEVKLAGHLNEKHFASLIGGEVKGHPNDKKDVLDASSCFHSVKSGTWWQIFLYGRSRLEKDSIFQGLGNVADIMIACIDAYPVNRADYEANKILAKQKLQPQMRELLAELQKPKTFKAFLDKALFDGGSAQYLSMFLGRANEDITDKIFHIFHKDDVVKALAANVTLQNSRARNPRQMDDQKVTFRSHLCSINIGEIEDRHDSKRHYRQMKFRLNAGCVFDILTNKIPEKKEASSQIVTYGQAVRAFKILR